MACDRAQGIMNAKRPAGQAGRSMVGKTA